MIFFRKREKQIWLIVGLGNPGPEYETTRHNCGFCAIDKLAELLNTRIDKHKFKGTAAEVAYSDTKRLVLLKPATYMNNSGESIQQALSWYKIPESRLIVIYDDCDLLPGQIRIRPKGSAGTHNGMKSVLQYTDSEEFARVRIGIGQKQPQQDIIKHVLGHFTQEERQIMDQMFIYAAKAVVHILDEGIEAAMCKYNGKINIKGDKELNK